MALDLKDKPGSQYDDELPSQHKPAGDSLEDDFAAPEIGDEDRNTDTNNKDTPTSTDLAEAESSGATPKASDPEKSEQQATGNNPSDIPYTDEGQSKGIRGRITKKQGIMGAVVGIFGIGSIAATIFLQGPLQFIHKAQLLQGFHFTRSEVSGDDRTAKFFLYALSGKAAKGRLGVLSNKVADRVELRLQNESGLKSVYHPQTGRFVGYQVVDPNKAKQFVKELEGDGIGQSDSLRGTDIDGKPINGSGGRYIDLSDGKFKNRRSVIRASTKAAKLNKVTSKLSSRLLIKRGGVNFHPLKNVTRKKTDDFFRWREDKKRDVAREHTTGETADLSSPLSEDEVPEIKVDGAPDLDSELNLPETPRSRILTKLRSIANTAKGPLLAAGIYCGVREFSNSVDAQNYENQQQLIRMGMGAVTVGSQAMTGQDVSMDILGALDDFNYDEKTGTSWSSDPGIQQESGEVPTGTDYNKDVKPGSKDKPVVFRVVDSVPHPEVAGKGLCDVFSFTDNVPGISHAMNLVSSGIDAALSSINVPTTKELMQMALNYFATGGVDTLAQGAKRGGLENIGTVIASNDQFIAMGGRELTDEEAKESKSVAMAELEYRQSGSNFYDKYLNPLDSNSLVAKAFFKYPSNNKQFLSTIANVPALLSSQIMIPLENNKVAATAEYDYGFQLYGFSGAELGSSSVEDPFTNSEYIESGERLEKMNNEYGNECFGMTISADGQLVYGKSVDFTKIPEKCKSNSPDLLKYRMYLYDMVNSHSIACNEGEEDSCSQIGFGSTASSSSGTQSTASSTIVGDPYTDSTSVACAPGTEDLDIQDGYVNGVLVKMRICKLPNLPQSGRSDIVGGEFTIPGGEGFGKVNSRMSGAWFALINDAKASGINLSSMSSFRTMAHQQTLCAERSDCAGGDYTFTAKPGTSSHQAGVAIDFIGMDIKGGKTCDRRANNPSNPAWVWLKDNASRYGIKQLAQEAWHWDAHPNSCA